MILQINITIPEYKEMKNVTLKFELHTKNIEAHSFLGEYFELQKEIVSEVEFLIKEYLKEQDKRQNG